MCYLPYIIQDNQMTLGLTYTCGFIGVERSDLPSPDDSLRRPLMADPSLAYKRRRLAPR
jgi:hypothetical protein